MLKYLAVKILSSSATNFHLFRSTAQLQFSVRPIQGLPRHQNVTQGAPWVGEVALLQDHHVFPDVPVSEVHPHFHPRQHLATVTFNWAGPRSCQ